jgi:hypothetical protein
MNEARVMKAIEKNLARVAASQRQSKARGDAIDKGLREIAAEQRRVAQMLQHHKKR